MYIVVLLHSVLPLTDNRYVHVCTTKGVQHRCSATSYNVYVTDRLLTADPFINSSTSLQAS